MDVTLHPEIERMVRERVQTGEYSNPTELVNAAVRDLLAREGAITSLPARHPRSLELAQDAPANLEWLNRNGAEYQGEWVALHKGVLIAHGEDGLEVFRAAQAKGINPPVMHRIIAEGSVSWGGW